MGTFLPIELRKAMIRLFLQIRKVGRCAIFLKDGHLFPSAPFQVTKFFSMFKYLYSWCWFQQRNRAKKSCFALDHPNIDLRRISKGLWLRRGYLRAPKFDNSVDLHAAHMDFCLIWDDDIIKKSWSSSSLCNMLPANSIHAPVWTRFVKKNLQPEAAGQVRN